jgi:uncharacterized membrane protein
MMQAPESLPSFPDNLDADPGDGLERVIGLSDGIFAFSMTLLAVNVDFPHLASNTDPAQVTAAVWELAPQIAIYATSFLLVAMYWQVHRRTFRFIKRNDAPLTWLNLLQLMFVAFLPVATGLFDTYNNVTAVVVLYAGTLFIIGALGWLLWWHAIRARLVDDKTSPIVLEYYTFRGTVTLIIYLFVLAVGVFIPAYARMVLLLFFLIYPFLQHIFRFWYKVRHSAQGNEL